MTLERRDAKLCFKGWNFKCCAPVDVGNLLAFGSVLEFGWCKLENIVVPYGLQLLD